MSMVFEHPWLGGLFADNKCAEIWSAERQLKHMLAFEAAYTRALGKAGKVPADAAEIVADGIERFAPDVAALRAGTACDGLPVPALIAQLKQAFPGHDRAIHTGATSQDVIDTALALTLREFSTLVGRRLAALAAALTGLSQLHGQRLMMGRTRMQAALPVAVADRLATWARPLDAHLAQLSDLRPRVEQLQLGGAVGNCSGLGPDAASIASYMAEMLGLGCPPKAWHSMREGIVGYTGLLSLISGILGKMGQDVSLMAQQGIDEISLDGGGGSSAMPHKQNPVLAELLVTLARFNATQVSGMHQALVHEQERSGAAWSLEWMILPQMAQATARSLAAALALCDQITSIGSKERL